jgi:class 3 adenylate cyclase/DNA-binding CsgD family transcriptional regulator/tetratricopeptide (TPR) repeat protein
MHQSEYCNCRVLVIILRLQDAYWRIVVAELAAKRENLSARERQIAEAYAAGRSYRDIAERLFIAPATVRTHLGAIYRKLGVSTKIELLRTLEAADGPGADPAPEEFAPSPQTAREPRADPSVTELLQELDLHQYADVFAANAVDMDVLMTLTDGDLRELGMLAIGHRRRLAAAIHKRRSSSDRAVGVEGSASEGISPAPAIGPLAERRHLTIAFVVLVGSMELSTQLDPEQMQELRAAYQKAIAKEAARFQGHVANVMGDGMLVSFGWPNAHEDDAERAIRASLEIRASVGALRSPEDGSLAVRIGVASGFVVVGEGMGNDAALAGDTPNLASHLRVLASPGQIIIAESTRRLLGDVFELADLGTKRVEGISEPVRIFAVTGERPVESRFDARSGSVRLPMVGRDQELALLLERWAQAKAGEGQGVLLVGEAGIGKSRIGRALLDAVAAETHIRIRYQCSPYHSDSALWPVTQQLCHAAALGPDDPLDAKLDKLEALLAQASGRDAAPLIADLIGLDGTARYGKLGLTPQVQRERTLEALVGQLLGLATLQPVLVVLEDAHWIDPTTLELIEQCLDCVADQRALILLTSRPDQQPELAAHLHVTRLALNRLARAGVEAIVARLGGDRLPLATIDTIVARTDGVPLFVEELTKAVLETGETTIPASLHDSLMARLDRIPEVKEIAQIAACIGREFDYPLLAAVVDRTESSLRSALDRLAAAELVFRRGTPPEASYRFKHTLVQDAAYASLLHRRRHELHARIGEVLEQRFPNRAEAEPETLAHHFSLSGDVAKGVRYMVQAGDWARRVFANDDALKHYQRARELAEASEVLAPERLVVLERLADLQGPAGRREEALGHYRTVLDALADAPAQARLHRKIAKLHWEAGAREEALSEFKAGLKLLEGHQDDMELAYLYCEMGRLAFRKGDNEGAVDWARHALDRAERVLAAASDDGLESAREAAGVVSEAYNTLGVAEARLSRRKDAIAYVERSLDVAERHGLLQTACRGYINLSVLYCDVDPRRAIETCRKGLAVAQKIGDLGFQSYLYVNLGIACCTFTGRCAGEGVAAIMKAIDLDRKLGLIDHLPVSLVVLGQVYQCHGQPQTAIDLYSEALKLAKDLDEPQILFPCYDGLATVYLDMDDVERAEHYMEQSRAVCARAGLNREALLMLPFLS